MFKNYYWSQIPDHMKACTYISVHTCMYNCIFVAVSYEGGLGNK